MQMLERDVLLIKSSDIPVQTRSAEGSINLSALQVAREPDVFDRVFALAFDTLCLDSLTIRVQEDSADDSVAFTPRH